MKKRKFTALRLNKNSISNFKSTIVTGGNDADATVIGCFTQGPACDTRDVFRCNTGDACRTVVGCPSFIRC